jgi:hypothetical protein
MWILWELAVLAALVHTWVIAYTRPRLRLDRHNAEFLAVTPFGYSRRTCFIQELRLGPVSFLGSEEEGFDTMPIHYLELNFGQGTTKAFTGFEQSELAHIRARLDAWLQSSTSA